MARAHRPDCFEDEAAIDFPSVRPLAERERDAFLGWTPDADLLRTEVSLTPRDARRGAVLPIDVSLQGTCVACGGRGERWPERCRACGGTGMTALAGRVLVSVPAGVPDGARLRFKVRAPLALSAHVEVRVAVRRPVA